jgi:hypothetical protein
MRKLHAAIEKEASHATCLISLEHEHFHMINRAIY